MRWKTTRRKRRMTLRRHLSIQDQLNLQKLTFPNLNFQNLKSQGRSNLRRQVLHQMRWSRNVRKNNPVTCVGKERPGGSIPRIGSPAVQGDLKVAAEDQRGGLGGEDLVRVAVKIRALSRGMVWGRTVQQ